ncbi:putative tRNA-synt_His domain-containing protein [Candidatus Hydrogenisulfobacillus filiaventi]|uniref:Putative tRNA-synt_His domain-containing protein n=1 Tax=Candidatus Hydrogenisulfobacillus filiaventi TaxID=2707344 RepID=A0A6F8ZEP0_9FIRM|nr:ATP phosphoribosyltransferase regulatory subunit [Bacillota bacterium]CAB1128237.1 putative tRNA-synt_His domain-containing protein [Candidatus Hydrogenisulfobacillus filiaventi]
MPLASWLADCQRRWDLSHAMVELVRRAGYQVVPTDPGNPQDLRKDHTGAIITRLLSWGSPLPPLKVFSWGPVYRPYRGTWEDAIDVEVLQAGVQAGEEDIRRLLRRLLERFPLPEPSRLVVGHIGLLHALLAAVGLEEDRRARVLDLLRQGDTLAAGRLLGPESWVEDLWRPLPLETVRAAVARTGLEADPRWEELAGWTTGPWSESRIDLSLVGSFPYYTGTVFHLYAPGWGQEGVAGGRYTWGEGVRGVGFVVKPEVWTTLPYPAEKESRA